MCSLRCPAGSPTVDVAAVLAAADNSPAWVPMSPAAKLCDMGRGTHAGAKPRLRCARHSCRGRAGLGACYTCRHTCWRRACWRPARRCCWPCRRQRGCCRHAGLGAGCSGRHVWQCVHSRSRHACLHLGLSRPYPSAEPAQQWVLRRPAAGVAPGGGAGGSRQLRVAGQLAAALGGMTAG